MEPIDKVLTRMYSVSMADHTTEGGTMAEGMFIVVKASTGEIIATDKTEHQAENIAASLRIYGRMNVHAQCRSDYRGGNIYANGVKLDEV